MELVILSGIQCSGKSSYYFQRFAQTHARINLDELKSRRKESILFASILEKSLPVVIDNTNPTRQDRSKYIQLAKSYGYRIVGIQFDIPISVAISRCSNRISQKEVPVLDIHLTAKKMQPLSQSEGFDEVITVTEFSSRPKLSIVKSV